MKTQVDKSQKLEFLIQGRVGHWEDRQNRSDYFVGKYLKEEISALSSEEAIQLARVKIADFLEQNKAIVPPALVNGSTTTFDFTLTQVLLRIKFVPATRGQAVIPAIPAVPSYIREIVS